ncbi:MAG: LPS assembly protein LptD [Chiayiivirga sp.]|uniref:LPS-assembly protein LptD n=1 Tax=Denitratimonas tolerans TaxID=1338420 RepID=A0AAW9R112_9GAMM|nr:LPS assembly protein LptD [Xanthomonadaceae bacterium]MDX9765479.1 LPS assembly protein LptD [Chiayiivirga sp.]MEB2314728.1 LPS assembly protein LptD [Xanthomonadaceae bacterium]
MPHARLALSLSILTIAVCTSVAQARSRLEYDPAQWVLCKPNALYEFYRPITSPEADRAHAQTQIWAHSIDLRNGDDYRLEGDVEIQRADQRVAAALLHYDPAQETWRAEGRVQYQDAGMLMEAASAQGELEAERATLVGLRYQLLQARGNGEADQATNQGDISRLEGVSYTTCDPDDRQWTIRARRVDIDQGEGMATIRRGTLRIGSVPVLYLPIATLPIDDRRKTGFLFPSVSLSRSRGFDLQVPYYINIAPNYDVTLTPRLMTKRGVMLGTEFRYLTDTQRGRFYGAWLPSDDRTGKDRGTLTWEHRGRLGTNWQLISNVSHISDDRYFEDFGDSLTMAATSLLESTAGIYGRGAGWSASLSVEDWTIADPYVPKSAEPFRRLPRALLAWEHPFAAGLVTGVRAEGVAFDRDGDLDATRVDVHPYVGWRYERAAGFIRPELGMRHTQYRLGDSYLPGFSDRSPSRTTPIFSLDTGLVFERRADLFGTRTLQTLEPRLYYLNVPYREQDALPIFDTQELGFSWGQLFRPNRFSGADRQSDANQATLAVSTRFFEEDSGRERLSASLGQIRYFEAQRVQMPGVPGIDRAGSAFVADVELQLDDRWSVAVSQHWDPSRELSDLSTLRTQYRFGGQGVVNFAYRFRRDAGMATQDRVTLEQFDASTLVPLNERWRFVARWNYSLLESTTLEAFAGVEWENCCLATRVLVRRYIRNFEGEVNTSLYVELELKGLSTLGRKSEELLERAILGYSH